MHVTMARRAWSKLCSAHRWMLLLLLLFPLFLFLLLLLLLVSVMTVTLPLPAPPVIDVDHRSSRALGSAGSFGSRPAGAEPLATDALQDEESVAQKHKNNIQREEEENTKKHESRAITGDVQHRPVHQHRPRLNNTRTRHRLKSRDHSAARSRSTEARWGEESLTLREADKLLRGRQTRAERTVGNHGPAAKHSGKSNNTSKEQWAVRKRHHHTPEGKKNHRSRCQRRFTELDFPDDDGRRIRVGPRDLQSLAPWLSEDDVQKMELLAGGEVVSKARVPAHGRVLQVALEPPAHRERPLDTHAGRCHRGRCSLVKRTDDWYEVFAFHLDRVLGLNRSLPAVLRTFQSTVLPYRYIDGSPRPVLWWDPDIQHLTDGDNDQNSVPLSWVQYQSLLRLRCGDEADLRSAPCVGVQHSEWGRLALFDFLLQVNDRLDRNCCGFTPDPSEVCVENLLQDKCEHTPGLKLVHILVRRADPSRLVFIDNAGRPQQTNDNLNFRLVEGIDEFPEEAVSVLQSGCLENRLLRSLYTDRELWASRGGVAGLRPLVRSLEQRGKILLQHIRDRKLRLQRDL